MAAETIRSESTPARGTPDASPRSSAFAYAKKRILLLVMERLDFTAVMQLEKNELDRQLRQIVAELLMEEQIEFDGPEHDLINLVVGEITDRRAKIQNKKVESGATRPWLRLGKRS
jgi:hypothetical protein